jgi:hypothetical protein
VTVARYKIASRFYITRLCRFKKEISYEIKFCRRGKKSFFCFFVIPAEAGIRAPGSRRNLRGESPLPGDADRAKDLSPSGRI